MGVTKHWRTFLLGRAKFKMHSLLSLSECTCKLRTFVQSKQMHSTSFSFTLLSLISLYFLHKQQVALSWYKPSYMAAQKQLFICTFILGISCCVLGVFACTQETLNRRKMGRQARWHVWWVSMSNTCWTLMRTTFLVFLRWYRMLLLQGFGRSLPEKNNVSSSKETKEFWD